MDLSSELWKIIEILWILCKSKILSNLLNIHVNTVVYEFIFTWVEIKCKLTAIQNEMGIEHQNKTSK